MTKRIAILGAGGTAARNFVEAVKLSSNDWQFIGVDINPYMLQLSDCEEKIIHYDPYLEFCENLNIDFVHAQPDEQVKILAFTTFSYANGGQDTPMKARTFLPRESEIAYCQDKMKSHEILQTNRVPVPELWPIEKIEHAIALYGRVWLRASIGAGSKAALPVSNILQVEGWLDYWGKETKFMVSEFLPGKEYAYQVIFYEGQIICDQARERIEYLGAAQSPSGQTSSPSVARTVSREDVYDIGEKAIRAISQYPHGVFGVDMKENGNGVPCVTEINAGRFYTTSNFFAHAGLNMPEIYLELGLGIFEDRPGRTDRLPDDLYWIRGVDCKPRLIDGSAFD